MDFASLKKIEHVAPLNLADDSLVTAIVKVKAANYHPTHLQVRMQIDDFMFTAQLEAKVLAALEADPLVEAISLAKPLPL